MVAVLEDFLKGRRENDKKNKIKYFLSETPYSSIIIKYKYYKKILTYVLFGYIITQTN